MRSSNDFFSEIALTDKRPGFVAVLVVPLAIPDSVGQAVLAVRVVRLTWTPVSEARHGRAAPLPVPLTLRHQVVRSQPHTSRAAVFRGQTLDEMTNDIIVIIKLNCLRLVFTPHGSHMYFVILYEFHMGRF